MTPHQFAERFLAMANGSNGNGTRIAIDLVRWGLPLLMAGLALYVTLRLESITARYDERFETFRLRIGRNENLINNNTRHREDTDVHMPSDVKFNLFVTKEELTQIMSGSRREADLRHQEMMRRLDKIEAKAEGIDQRLLEEGIGKRGGQ